MEERSKSRFRIVVADALLAKALSKKGVPIITLDQTIRSNIVYNIVLNFLVTRLEPI